MIISIVLVTLGVMYGTIKIVHYSRLQEKYPEKYMEYEKKCEEYFIFGYVIIPFMSLFLSIMDVLKNAE